MGSGQGPLLWLFKAQAAERSWSGGRGGLCQKQGWGVEEAPHEHQLPGPLHGSLALPGSGLPARLAGCSGQGVPGTGPWGGGGEKGAPENSVAGLGQGLLFVPDSAGVRRGAITSAPTPQPVLFGRCDLRGLDSPIASLTLLVQTFSRFPLPSG